jgi:F0F1-type ATP synthase assembly protein I
MPGDSPTFGGRDLLGLGAFLVGAVVGCTALGIWLDSLFHSAPVCAIVGVFVGIGGAGVGFAVRTRAALRAPIEPWHGGVNDGYDDDDD